ncbi:hypothetical protein GG344DRAFT_84404 [Lentinula edodes]|nr:hypothetical protein GG344DRAFT_84404 [Lentinula edodes]
MIPYAALSFPFPVGAVSSSSSISSSLSPSFSTSSSISSSLSPSFSTSSSVFSSIPLASSSSLSTTLRLFLDEPDGPASGISGGDLLLLAALVISQSNFLLKSAGYRRVAELPGSQGPPGARRSDLTLFLVLRSIAARTCIWQEIFLVLHRSQGSLSSSLPSSPLSGSPTTG